MIYPLILVAFFVFFVASIEIADRRRRAQEFSATHGEALADHAEWTRQRDAQARARAAKEERRLKHQQAGEIIDAHFPALDQDVRSKEIANLLRRDLR
jgi:hypothetical protein